MSEDSMLSLVCGARSLRFEALSRPVVEGTKKNLLDTIGCIIAGSTAEGCAVVRDYALAQGGRRRGASLFAFGGRAPAPLAALVNGTIARARDMGNTHLGASVHSSEYVVPAALVAADAVGGISGRELLVAEAVGEDALCRIGMCLRRPCGITGRYNLFRIFGPTLAASLLYGLDEEQSLMAMGLAFMQAGGEMQAYVDGALSIRVQQGLVCEAALRSVLLAQAGITGSRNILDGKFGFFTAFEPDSDRMQLLEDLGTRFEGINVAFKAYPCCGRTHAAIEAASDLIREHSIEPSQIKAISVGLNEFDYNLVAAPESVKRTPTTIPDAQFSIYYTVARAILDGSVSLRDFTRGAIGEPRVLELARKIQPRVDPTLKNEREHAAVVDIVTTDGMHHERRLDAAKGDPARPMSMSELVEKFEQSCAFSASKAVAGRRRAIADLILNIEDVDDVRQLIALITPGNGRRHT